MAVVLVPLVFGLGAVFGVIPIVIGHAVLLRTDIAVFHNFSLASSAQLGAVGGAIMACPMAVLIAFLRIWAQESTNAGAAGGFGISLIGTMAVAGIGGKVLQAFHLHVMGFVDALRASLLGGAILGAALIVAGVLFLIFGFIAATITWWRVPKEDKLAMKQAHAEMQLHMEEMRNDAQLMDEMQRSWARAVEQKQFEMIGIKLKDRPAGPDHV